VCLLNQEKFGSEVYLENCLPVKTILQTGTKNINLLNFLILKIFLKFMSFCYTSLTIYFFDLKKYTYHCIE